MDKKPALDAELVQEFVVNAHGNLERVKELLEQEPAWSTPPGIGAEAISKLRSAEQVTWAGRILPIICSNTAQGWISLQQPCWANWKSSKLH